MLATSAQADQASLTARADLLSSHVTRPVHLASGKQLISTDKAPAAVGAYSQAVKAGQTLYISGQVGLIPGVKNDEWPHHCSWCKPVIAPVTASVSAS